MNLWPRRFLPLAPSELKLTDFSPVCRPPRTMMTSDCCPVSRKHFEGEDDAFSTFWFSTWCFADANKLSPSKWMNERMGFYQFTRVWWSSLQVVLFVFMKEIYLNPQSSFYSQADVHQWNILYSKGALCMLNVQPGHPLLSVPIDLINSNNLFCLCLSSTPIFKYLPSSVTFWCFHNIPSISFYPL